MESGKILKITKTGGIARDSPGSSHIMVENRSADARCVGAARRDKDPHE